jgi:hypothetical protein
LGDHLADVPCVASGRPNCGRALRFRCGRALGRPTCRRALRCGCALPCVADVPCVALGRPTCGRALRCGCALPCVADVPCVALGRPTCGRADVPCVADVRWATQLADVPCVALGRPTCCLALRTCLAFALRTCVGAPNLRTCLALRCGAQLADVPHVAFGRPSCGRALRCVGAPNLGEAVLKSLPPSQNLFLSILQTILRTCLAVLWGAQLADVPCVADVPWGAQLADVPCVVLGRPTCGCALCCVWAPILRTRLALRWGAQPW